MTEALFILAGFALGMTWPFGQQAVTRAAAMFSTDEHVRALRGSSDRLEKLLAESLYERWALSGTNIQLRTVLQKTSDELEAHRRELGMYRGTINGQAIGSA